MQQKEGKQECEGFLVDEGEIVMGPPITCIMNTDWVCVVDLGEEDETLPT